MRLKRLIVPCIIFYFLFIPWAYSTECNFAPAFYYVSDGTVYTYSVFGPLLELTQDHLALRPLFYKHTDFTDIIYPLGHFGKERSYFIPFYSSLNQEEVAHKDFFPFFYGNYEKDPYIGIFPLYGKMYHRFGYDETKFVLWPIYAETLNNDIRTYSILWPIFTYSEDKAFKIFPIYGQEIKDSVYQQYLLWPIFHRKRGKETMDAMIPLFVYSRGDSNKNISILWPFFTYNHDQSLNHVSLDFPWPFVRWASGEYEETKVFPFYWTKTTKDLYSRETILWPIYTKTESFDKETLLRKSTVSIFILSSKTHSESKIGEKSDALTLWPLLNIQKDHQSSSWRFPYIIPIEDDGLTRNWMPLITLVKGYRSETSSAIDILWHTFSLTEKDNKSRWSLSFLCSFEEESDHTQLGFFFDLFKFSKNK